MSVVSTGPAPTNRSRHAPRPGSLYYEKELRAASVTHKHYIAGVAVVTLSGSTWATQYLHRDHLGSVTAITDHTGTVIERFAYDPWGKRRFPDGAPDPNGTIRGDPTLAFATDRGFTNHEHLDGLGLIHMNGRIFDPTLARFTSADPHIQHPGNMQSYNRYSYVLNNPLIYTDPTGYFLKKVFKSIKKAFKKILKNPIVRAIAAIAVAYLTGVYEGGIFGNMGWSAATTTMANGAAAGFAGGFVGSGGNFKAAMQGAFIGAAFGYVGGKWAPNTFANYAGHAVVGCASSEAQGGNCAQGAAAQLASKWATIKVDRMDWNTPAQFTAATVVGGTANVIGGGKFANGALTASAGYLFNQLGSRRVMQQPTVDGHGGMPGGGGGGAARGLSRPDAVIAETLAGKGNPTSTTTLSADDLLNAGIKFLGPGYKQIGKPNSGVFRSADGTRQFRIDNGSLTGSHPPGVPHGHLEVYKPGAAKPTVSNHIPFYD